jgi:membrane fusion protein (multidrug efflux system)
MKTSAPILRRAVIFLVVAAALTGATYLGISLNSSNPPPKAASGPVVVETAVVQAANIEDAITAIGTLRAAESVVIKSEVAGRISRISFSDGATVSRGDELIAFDAAIQQAQLQQARAERDLASAKLQRTQELFDRKFLSAAALDDARASEQVAQARLALAQANLDKMSLKAPFTGLIGIRQISVGDYIKEGADLVNMEDISSMKADFRVPEQVSGRLKVGQSVNLESDAFPGVVFPARVSAIDPSVDAAGRSLLLRAELRDASRRLKPGMFLRVRLVLDMRENALVVPEEALVNQQGRQLVFRVTDGNAVSVPVRAGLRVMLDRRAMVEIQSGLTAGDVIVTAGQIKIRGNNVPVRSAVPPPVKGS